MCGMSEGLRSRCLQLTPESRAHCVAAEGEQRHFHRRNFGFLSIRRAASQARAVFICLCTVGICAAVETHTFQTTSGGCINSTAQWNIKAGERGGENSFCFRLSPFTAGSGSDEDVGNRDPERSAWWQQLKERDTYNLRMLFRKASSQSDLRRRRTPPDFSHIHWLAVLVSLSLNCVNKWLFFFIFQGFDAKRH